MWKALTILILGSVNLFCAELSTIKINSDGYSYIYFDSIPKYETILSDDKTKLRLILNNTKLSTTNEQVNSSGKIKEIYSYQKENNTELLLTFNDKSGFNIIPQFLSQSLRIEIFNWSDLSPYEDKYRTAMLGFEEGIYESVIEGLKSASKDSIIDATAYLGIIFLKQGKINSSEKVLLNAETWKSTVFDIYAALGQIYDLKKDSLKSKRYYDLFFSKSDIKSVTKINIDTLIERDNSIIEDLSFLVFKEQDLTESDSLLNRKFESIFSDRDTLRQTDFNTSNFPWWFEYIVWIVIGFLILVIFFYLKWRQNQLKNKNRNKKSKVSFSNEIKASNEEVNLSRSALVAKYKQNINLNDEKYSDEKNSENLNIESEEENVVINKALDAIKIKQKEKAIKDEELQNSKNAQIKLAMNLAEEQKKIKSNEIKNFSDNLKNADLDKLNKIALKLGIEKGIEENVNKFEQIKSDKDTLDKLTKKFSKKL